jgi:hypothetical protein
MDSRYSQNLDGSRHSQNLVDSRHSQNFVDYPHSHNIFASYESAGRRVESQFGFKG